MKTLNNNNLAENKQFKRLLCYVAFPLLLLIGSNVFAGGTDLLAGTSDDLVQTITGEGKKYLYLAEIVVGAIGFIKTRNPAIFIGVIILSVGFNVLLDVAGITT